MNNGTLILFGMGFDYNSINIMSCNFTENLNLLEKGGAIRF